MKNKRIRKTRSTVFGQDIGSRRHRPDYALGIISLVLLAIGLVVVYAMSPGLSTLAQVADTHFIYRQMIAIGLAFVSFIVFSRLPFTFWRSLVRPLIAVTVLTLLATQFIGSGEASAARWVQIGGLSFQSVELLKFTLIIWLSGFLATRQRNRELNDIQKTLKPIAIVLLVTGFIVAVLQSDLGSMGVVAAIIVAMLFVAGLSFRWMAVGLAGVVIGGLVLIASSPYRQERVATFLNPQSDCLEEGYQACQALIAVGSGGLFGKGIDQSAQAYGYLPEAANDSIFAVLAEMFGFLGVVVVIGLFIALFTRMVRVIERAPNTESRLIVVGILAWLSTQAFINIMAMVGLFPLKGITLPFISYGGTSLIFVTAAVGLVFNISRYTTYSVHDDMLSKRFLGKRKERMSENSTQRRRYGRTHYSHSLHRS
jgi:cell division protein FtsW